MTKARDIAMRPLAEMHLRPRPLLPTGAHRMRGTATDRRRCHTGALQRPGDSRLPLPV